MCTTRALGTTPSPWHYRVAALGEHGPKLARGLLAAPQALLRYSHRTYDPRKADVIYLAHYFLTENPVTRQLDFGPPLFGWDEALKSGGPEGLFNGSGPVLERWAARPADFVAAPILLACLKARGFLHAAR